MTKEEKLEAIYSKIANKELSEWCKITYCTDNIVYTTVNVFISNPFKDYIVVSPWYNYTTPKRLYRKYIEKIHWHPVLIGDVLTHAVFDEWLQPNDILSEWGVLIIIIDEQSSECIDYIFNLLD